MNVNYEPNDLKNESQWQIATSRNRHDHSAISGKVTLEINRKSNEIYLKLRNRFSPLYNIDQNLTRKKVKNYNSYIPEKMSTNSRNTSPHATNTVPDKRPLVCTTDNYLKGFIPFTVPGNGDYGTIIKNRRKVLIVGDSHIKTI